MKSDNVLLTLLGVLFAIFVCFFFLYICLGGFR